MANYADFFANDSDSSDDMLLGAVRAVIMNNDENRGQDDAIPVIAAVLDHVNADARTTVERYVEDIVPTYSEREFLSHFRVKRSLVDDLARRFGESEVFRTLGLGGFVPVSPTKRILTFLWYVGHEAASYRDVADRFDLSLDALYSVITRVTDFLLILASSVICFPSQEEKEATKAFFYERKGFPGVIGAVDGCHIRLDKPSGDPDAYINRKQYYSEILQGVVSEKRKFIDVFIGYPGSVHDTRVFRNSSLKDALLTLCDDGSYILGDSAYPCSTHLLVPYRDNGHLSRAQHRFNSTLSSCRIVVEHAFGLLKQRFRQLYHLKMRDMTRIVRLVHACCVLHNLADEEDLTHLEPPLDDDHTDQEAIARERVVVGREEEPADSARGRELRDELCRRFAAARV